MIDNKPNLYWSNVLQALTHWISYKEQYFHDHLLTEGAIVAELTQLLSSKIKGESRVLCEIKYSDLNNNISDATLIDIVVGKKTFDKKRKKKIIKKDDVTEVIEVKRYENSYKEILNDFEKLHRLKDALPNAKLYQIVAAQKKLPKKIFTEKHNLKKTNISDNTLFKAIPRIGKKTFTNKVKSDKGVYAALIEII